jgi:formate dehydrogenase alpha subunit
VAACQDVQRIYALTLLDRTNDASIGVFDHGRIAESNCTSCGQCVATCPTQALRQKEPRSEIEAPTPLDDPRQDARIVETTCAYCGVGCGIKLHIGVNNKIVQVGDVPENLSSRGMLCVKGRFGVGFVHSPDRFTTPLVRPRKRAPLEPATWDDALNMVAVQLRRHRGHLGVLGSAKTTNEDSYVLQKLARVVLKTNNVDHCSRLCHAPSVAGMTEMLGSGSTTNSYADFEKAGCLMVVGSDTDSNHPVIAARIRRAIEQRGSSLIVVNPREIGLCGLADLWLRPRAGTDVSLFNGLAWIALHEGWWDQQFVHDRTEDFETWRLGLEPYSPDAVAAVTGIAEGALREAAERFARPAGGGSCILWGMGITQHTQGLANVQAMVNLALLTGQVGKAGSGLSPLRGQNNVQGCGDAGVLPDTLPGYQGLGETACLRFEAVWKAPIPRTPGLKLTEMFDAAIRGDMRALYLVGENPLLTEPNVSHARRGLEALDFFIVQTLFPNETTELADVVLPATTFAEKDGTFTNSERRVQLVRKALDPPGEAREDWRITCQIADRILDLDGLPHRQFEFEHPREIFAEMASLVPFLGGVSHARLEAGGLQWPCPTDGHPGTPLLFGESFPRGRGRFVSVQQAARAGELPDDDYPLVLSTGRVLYHWHGGDLTRRVSGLERAYPLVELSMNPNDALSLGLFDGERVRIVARRGETTAQLAVTGAQREGEVFLPFVSLDGTTANLLTNDVYEPRVRTPEYKACAVRVERL